MTSPLFDEQTIRKTVRLVIFIAIGCVVLASLSAVAAYSTTYLDDKSGKYISTGYKNAYWLFPSIAPSVQYFVMTIAALGLVMLAALAIGGLAGAILMVEPNTTATLVPTKRGLETIAASAPSFLLGIGTAGLVKLANYLGDQAKALGKFIGMGEGAETLSLSLIGGVSFFFLIGVLMGISYQMKEPPTPFPSPIVPTVAPQPAP